MSDELWVLVEHDGVTPRKVTLELLGRGRELGVRTTAVVLAADPPSLARALEGATDRVLEVADPRFDRPDVEGAVAALSSLIAEHQPSLVVAGATSWGRDVMPRTAARMGLGLAPGCTALAREDGKFRVRLPVQGGKAYAELDAREDATVLATLRPNTYAYSAAASEGSAEVLSVQPDLGDPPRIIDESFEPIAGGRVPLEEAEIVVAGGRGVGDGFALVEELADVLGGAVAASRAVVDARLRPVEEQVGKSGKTVSPRIYFAVGISGAVHHTMGMDTSGTVVAINSDPAAPIFGQADFGLVGAAAEVLPALTQRLKG